MYGHPIEENGEQPRELPYKSKTLDEVTTPPPMPNTEGKEHEWQDVIGFDEYEINEADIRHKKTGMILTKGLLYGYVKVSLRKKGLRFHLCVHRLLAIQFIPNPENKPQVNHKNGIKTDNRICNLEWATNQENSRHAWDNGLCSRAKLTKADVLEIRASDDNGYVLAKRFNVSRDVISGVKRRKYWPTF